MVRCSRPGGFDMFGRSRLGDMGLVCKRFVSAGLVNEMGPDEAGLGVFGLVGEMRVGGRWGRFTKGRCEIGPEEAWSKAGEVGCIAICLTS